VLSLAFLGDQVIHFFSLVHCAFVAAESSSCELDCFLFFGCNTGLDELSHLSLEGSEASDFSDDFTNNLNSLVEFTLSENGSLFAETQVWFSDNKTFVPANEDSTLADHLFY